MKIKIISQVLTSIIPVDYAFSFELGIAPEVDVKGVAETDVYTHLRCRYT
jgi:hypothetical protein